MILSKNSADFESIKQLKLRTPTRTDWQIAREAGPLIEQTLKNTEYAVMGFILGVACDASAEDIQGAAQLLIQRAQELQAHMSQNIDIKFKLFVYLTNIQSIAEIVKQYFKN